MLVTIIPTQSDNRNALHGHAKWSPYVDQDLFNGGGKAVLALDALMARHGLRRSLGLCIPPLTGSPL